MHRQHGKSGSANTELVEQELLAPKALLSGYASRGIFNADETELFYRMSPDQIISARQTEGMKRNNKNYNSFLCKRRW
ncbi:hypothetical protein K3495_g1741 [Podosphaera aphanis]|nr:hypothetical protein K3495_g1741 [Podosphaera aphanis]